MMKKQTKRTTVFIVSNRPWLDGDIVAKALDIDRYATITLYPDTIYVDVLGATYSQLPIGDWRIRPIEDILDKDDMPKIGNKGFDV